MSEKKDRSILADVVRGFAIITVVIGHCIQIGNGEEYNLGQMFWNNKVYQFIYSFHMPLFMLIAGWFVYYSLKKLENDRKAQFKFLGKKIFLYLTPVFIWTTYEFVRGYIINKRNNAPTLGFPEIIPEFINYFLTNLWFLWAVLACLIILFIMHFYLKDNMIIYSIGFLAMFVVTDGYNLGVYKYLLPFYLAAYYTNANKEKLLGSKFGGKIKEIYIRRGWLCVLGTGVVFALLFLAYSPRAFIYLSGYKLTRDAFISQFIVDVYRMIIGFAGSGFFILLFDQLVKLTKSYKWPVLKAFGQNSLGIYILQGYLILIGMARITNHLGPNGLRVAAEAICICAISLLGAIIIDKIPVVRCCIGKMFFKNSGE